jgi:hypothetical protein
MIDPDMPAAQVIEIFANHQPEEKATAEARLHPSLTPVEIAVDCPTCGAVAGAPCVSHYTTRLDNGRPISGLPHNRRFIAASGARALPMGDV